MDKDLVHEFVINDGLDCLIKVGAEADQNYQNYILRGKSVEWTKTWFMSLSSMMDLTVSLKLELKPTRTIRIIYLEVSLSSGQRLGS